MELKPEMRTFIICKAMGWTRDECLNQPTWFIEIAWHYIQEEAKEQNRRSKA